jgi:hypothetical protein
VISYFSIGSYEACKLKFEDGKDSMARNSVKIGIVMLLFWAVPLIGFALALVGILLAVMDRSGTRPDLVRAGIFLNSLGLCLALLNITLSIYLVVSGVIDPAVILQSVN